MARRYALLDRPHVPDVDRATAFYSAVVGWSFSTSDEKYGGYVIGSVGDAAAAGIGPQQAPDQPAAWTLYFATTTPTHLAGRVIGRRPDPPRSGDVGSLGRIFIAADPTGAVFGVWQAGAQIGAAITNEPGGLSWEDLRSTDPDAARAFYGSVFGFDTKPLEMAPPDYGPSSRRLRGPDRRHRGHDGRPGRDALALAGLLRGRGRRRRRRGSDGSGRQLARTAVHHLVRADGAAAGSVRRRLLARPDLGPVLTPPPSGRGLAAGPGAAFALVHRHDPGNGDRVPLREQVVGQLLWRRERRRATGRRPRGAPAPSGR